MFDQHHNIQNANLKKQSQDSGIGPFRWDQLDQRILSPKRQELAAEMHERIVDGERRIEFEVAQSRNEACYLPGLFKLNEKLTDEWVGKAYALISALPAPRRVRNSTRTIPYLPSLPDRGYTSRLRGTVRNVQQT